LPSVLGAAGIDRLVQSTARPYLISCKADSKMASDPPSFYYCATSALAPESRRRYGRRRARGEGDARRQPIRTSHRDLYCITGCVSVAGYTAYMQRQQVRAAVWPILEFDSSNGPDIHFTVSNKGVGPAIIKHVIMKVDGQPVKNWNELLDKLLGPGQHKFSESDISGHVFAAGESMDVSPRVMPTTTHSPIDPTPLDTVEQGLRARLDRDLLLFNTWRMLDPARRRISAWHNDRDPSLPNSVRDYV
jgi:hypothetical protein